MITKCISEMKKISLVLSVLLLVASCRKDTDVFHVDEEIIIGSSQWTGQISNFYAEVDDAHQSYTFNAAFAATFRTTQQTEFHFNPYAFSTEAGVIVDGSIHFDVLQVESRGDLVLHNISTLVDGQVMELSSLYEVEALKGNLPLRLANGEHLEFTFPTEVSPTHQELIYGDVHQDGVIFSSADTQGNSSISPTEIFDEGEDVWRMAITSKSNQLGWFGCGQKIDAPEGTTTICVNLPEGFNHFNSAVFLVFEDYWSVVKLQGSVDGSFCTDHIPVGAEVKIVSISEREPGNFYLDFKDIIMAEGLENVVNLQPESTPLNEIMVWIQSI